MAQRDRSIERRDFLRSGARLAGAVLPLPRLASGGGYAGIASAEQGGKDIILRTLGRTGIRIPVVSLGAVGEAGLIRAALDAGVVYFDTAYRYGGGASESLIGEVLQGRPRGSYVAATKIPGLRDNTTGLVPTAVTPAEFRADFRKKVETSLKRLRVEYLDILYLHGLETAELPGLPMIKDVLLELKAEGKTRFLGATFHHKELELIPAVVKEKIYDVILTSHNFRQPHREAVRTAIAEAARAGLGVIAMKTVAGAYWDKEREHPIDVKAALKWVLQDENVHSIIPGIGNFSHLAQDLSLLHDLTLTPREEAALRFGERSGLTGLYCAQCGACRSQCRHRLDIPVLMRSYMYAYGYGNPRLAKETLREKQEATIACRSCRTCSVACVMRFDVPERIRDVCRVLRVPDEFLPGA